MHADTDFVIMDDPLSAVDVHVGRHMFTSCIQGALCSGLLSELLMPVRLALMLAGITFEQRRTICMLLLCSIGVLKGRTRLLITNQLQYLPQCDHIFFMLKVRLPLYAAET